MTHPGWLSLFDGRYVWDTQAGRARQRAAIRELGLPADTREWHRYALTPDMLGHAVAEAESRRTGEHIPDLPTGEGVLETMPPEPKLPPRRTGEGAP